MIIIIKLKFQEKFWPEMNSIRLYYLRILVRPGNTFNTSKYTVFKTGIVIKK